LLLAWEHLDWYGPALAQYPISWVIENSGKSIIGAVVGAYVMVLVAKRWLGYTRSTGDCYAFALPIGVAIGRIGCFLSELPLGKSTDLPWGIRVSPEAAAAFPYCPGCDVGMHPTMLYELFLNLGIFSILWFVLRKGGRKDGFVFASYIVMYSASRLFVEHFRADSLMLGPLRAAQLVSVLLALTVLGVIFKKRLWKRA